MRYTSGQFHELLEKKMAPEIKRWKEARLASFLLGLIVGLVLGTAMGAMAYARFIQH